MGPEQVAMFKIGVGFLLLIGAGIAWKWLKLDFFAFLMGISGPMLITSAVNKM